MPPRTYQIVHTLAGEPRALERHVALLDEASRALFGRHSPFGLQTARRAVAALLRQERPSREYSFFVRLAAGPDGEAECTADGASLYRGYTLRTLTPDGATLRYELPFAAYPTDARDAAAALADACAGARSARCAVRCDDAGRMTHIGGEPLFAVQGRRLYAPSPDGDVPRETLLRAAETAGLEITEEAPLYGLLPRIDELFFVDRRGITALAHCDGQPLMRLTAERLAAGMEKCL